jgi:hypothetical protein
MGNEGALSSGDDINVARIQYREGRYSSVAKHSSLIRLDSQHGDGCMRR